MATTSPDNLFSPDLTGQYALVQDLGAMQTSVQAALVKRANAYVGTSSQRIAFTSAPEGTQWRDTNGNKWEYVRKAGVWVVPNPIASGSAALSVSTSGDLASVTVNLPAGLFTVTPTVVLQIRNPVGHHPYIQYRVSSTSPTSFSIQGRSTNTATSYTLDFDWIATAMQ